jgi:pyruvate kinase
MARTKIVCTLGPATDAPGVLDRLVAAGLRVARINCSHGSVEEHTREVTNVRAAAAKAGVALAVLYDLCGPKIRTGDMAEPLPLAAGEEFTLTSRPPAPGGRRSAEPEIPLGFADLPKYVQPGQRILFDDGALAAEVLAVTDTDLRCRALNTAPLGGHKGINLPGASLPIPAFTEKDAADLRAGLRAGVDWVAMSFVRRADDLAPVRALMAEEGITRPIIAKIEKHEAVANLEEIIAAYDGVMVARGDLGVEVSLEEVPVLQKRIIRAANAAGVPVITATQMLDSMIRNPRPTRAEVTDVANAILDGTDAVMLSGETAVGQYPVEAVEMMARVADEAETLIPIGAVPAAQAPMASTPTGALAAAAVEIAERLGAAAIVASTLYGHTANLVAKSRPLMPIIAATPVPETFTQLPLLWGVTPVLVPPSAGTDEMLDRAVRAAVRLGIVKDGDLLVVVAVSHQPVGVVTRATNILRIARVERGAGRALPTTEKE